MTRRKYHYGRKWLISAITRSADPVWPRIAGLLYSEFGQKENSRGCDSQGSFVLGIDVDFVIAKAFRDGQIAFHFDWPGWYGLTKDPEESKVADTFGLAPYPVGPAGYVKIWGGSHGFAVAKATKNPEAAAELVKFLTSADNLYFEAVEGGFLPTSISAFAKIKEDAAETGDPLDLTRLELLEEELAGFVPATKIPEYQEMVSAMWPELQKSLVAGRDVKETLDIIAEKVQKIVSPE